MLTIRKPIAPKLETLCLVALISALGVFAAAPEVIAADPSWIGYPIHRGVTTAITSDPGNAEVFYVGTAGAGVFKTTNLGDSWSLARQGLEPVQIDSLAVSPHNSDTVLAGTAGRGIFRSGNGGASWTATTGIYPDQDIVAIVFDPVDSSIVFAAGSYYSEGNIYRSSNGGATWMVSDDGLPGSAGSHTEPIRCLVIDSTDPDLLYAGTSSSGVYRSTDSADNWVQVAAGLPNDGSDFDDVSALTISSHDQHPWAVVSTFDGGLYRLDDLDTWQKISADMELYDGSHLYIMPDDANIMFTAGTRIEKSTDGGVTWDWSLGHPDSGDATELAFHSILPTTLLASGAEAHSSEKGGVFRTLNRGVTWDLSTEGITAASLNSVAVDPSSTEHIVVGTEGGGVMSSQDGGATWTWAYRALDPDYFTFGFGISDIVIDPADSSWVYIASNSLWASNDGGVSFSEISEGDWAECLAVAPGPPTTVYVGTSFGYGIVKGSAAGGWAPANNGFPTCFSGFCDTKVLAVDPNDPQVVWAGTEDGIVRTTDAGASWARRGLDGDDITDLAVSPLDSSDIIAATWYGEIYKSTNGGVSWELRHQDLDPVTSLAYHPRQPLWLYAATKGSGVLRSPDGGYNWNPFSTGMFSLDAEDLSITTGDKPVLFAATKYSGLYSRGLTVVGGIFSDGFESGNTSAWTVSVP